MLLAVLYFFEDFNGVHERKHNDSVFLWDV